jgi:CMP-N-acetylneuraminic acid synthetase
MPTQSIPGEYYVQNASLEMAWTYVLNETGTISGYRIAPFFTDAMEGFDINVESDMVEAQRIIDEGKWTCSASNSAG